MRHFLKVSILGLSIALGLVLIPAQNADTPGQLVDFRMAPLEQVKKIHAMTQTDDGPGATVTIFIDRPTEADRNHLIIGESAATPDYIKGQFADGEIDSLSWTRKRMQTDGACDSKAECQDKTDELCEKAGHGGVKEISVKVTTHPDGSKTCSGDCKQNLAVAFVTCNPKSCTLCS